MPSKPAPRPNLKTSPPPVAAPSWKIKPSRLLILLGVLVVGVGLFLGYVYGLKKWGKRTQLIAEARAQSKVKGKEAQALAFLKEYLATNPDDLEALELWSDILFRSSKGSPEGLAGVVKADEAILKLDPEPDGQRAQSTRKRLVEAYLLRGPFQPAQEQQYEAARILVEDLEKRTKRPDPAVLRLHAQVLLRLAAGADEARIRAAAEMFEKAQAMDPKDVPAAAQLAGVYFFGLHDARKATDTLDNLAKAAPTVPAYLAVADFRGMLAQDYASAGKAAQAEAEVALADKALAAALAEAPRDLSVRISAASAALRRKDPKKAREHLDAVPEADRSDYRYRLTEGVVDLQENRADDAIESWSRGLLMTGGSDSQLSFRLAYVLLALGRVDEAEDLISQYRRVVGGREPSPEVRYLQAMRLLKLNHPVEAIAELEKSRLAVPAGLKPQYYFLMGQCRLATRDTDGALSDFKEALDADPRQPLPRLARARLLEAENPTEAVAELKRGLAAAGNDPSLIGELARMEFRVQAKLPARRRSFAALDALLASAGGAAAGSADVTIARAQQLAALGKPDDASALLEKATLLDRGDPNLWLARAEQLALRNKFPEALMVLEQAADPKAAGDQAPLRILKAKVLTLMGRGTEARGGLIADQEHVRPDQRPLLWQELGRLYDIQKDPRNARKAYARWAELLPDDPLPWIQLLELSLNEGTDEARATADEARAALDRIGGFYARVGEAIAALREPKAAEAPAAAAERLDRADRLIAEVERSAPRTRFPHVLRATWWEKKGDPSRAAEALERALPTEGGAAVAMSRLNRIYTSLKRDDDLKRLRLAYPELARLQAELFLVADDKERAAALARQVARENPDGLESQVWVATILNTAGKADEAEALLAEFAARDPEKLGPSQALMSLQVARGRKAEAAKTLEGMIARVKGLDRPELTWARCWRAVGQAARADASYDEAVRKWPEDPAVIRDAADYYGQTGRPRKTEDLLRGVVGRGKAPERWAVRGLAVLLAGSGQAKAWKEAWALVASPPRGMDTAEERMARALVLSYNDDPARRREAVALLKGLVADLPADLPMAATARTYLVRGLLGLGQATEAVEVAALDARAANAPAPAVLLMANALVAANLLDEASREIDRLEKLAPGDLTIAVLRAQVLKGRGRAAEGSKLLFDLAALRLNDPDGEAVGRFLVRALVEDLKDLEAAYAASKIVADKYPAALTLRAAVLARQGKTREAMDLYLDAARTADDAGMLDAVRSALGMVENRRDADTLTRAEAVVEAARKRSPNSPDLSYMAGVVRHYQGRYSEEVGLYQAALDARPDDLSFLNNMAWTLSVSLNEPAKGLDKIQRAFNTSKDLPPQFYDTLGVTLTKLGKFDEAITNLKMAVKERPNALGFAHLARAYYRRGLMKEFADARDRAVKAGFDVKKIDPDEREELSALILGPQT